MDADTKAAKRADTNDNSEVAEIMLAEIDALAPEIAMRANWAETSRRIPPDIIQALKTIGVFRITDPKVQGGMEFNFLDAVRVLQRLTRIEGSVGWLAVIRAAAGVVLPCLPYDTYEEIYRKGPDFMWAGANQPSGTAEAVPNGWRVNGRWPFSSGCQDADWICVNCVLTRDGQPIPAPAEGTPATSFVVLPAGHAKIDDTWYASGLKATGSHHVVFEDVMITQKHFFDFATARPCMPGPLYGAPMQLVTLFHGTLALGMAEGALSDVVSMARRGRQQQRATTSMRNSEIFQYELGRAQAKLKAAQMVQDDVVARHWQDAQAGSLNTEAKLIESTQSSLWITETCLEVARTCFTLAGAAAVFDHCPLQRRLRDLEVAAQHVGVHQQQYAQAGRLLLSASK